METNKKLLEKKLYADLLARQQLVEALKQLQHSLGEKVPSRVIGMTACTLAAYRLTSRAIQARRTKVHELLQACRAISKMQIATKLISVKACTQPPLSLTFLRGHTCMVHLTAVMHCPSVVMGSV